MRIFAALVPPEEALEHLDGFLDVRRAAADFRWSPVGQLHLTLAFLPSVDDWRLDDLLERIGEAAGRRTPLLLRVAGGGAFPDPVVAKVLWAGLELDGAASLELERLATGCRIAAGRAGVRVDGQRFRPHVSVARISRAQQVGNWVRLLEGYQGPSWWAGSVRVVASHLGEGPRRRPRYEVLADLPLGG